MKKLIVCVLLCGAVEPLQAGYFDGCGGWLEQVNVLFANVVIQKNKRDKQLERYYERRPLGKKRVRGKVAAEEPYVKRELIDGGSDADMSNTEITERKGLKKYSKKAFQMYSKRKIKNPKF